MGDSSDRDLNGGFEIDYDKKMGDPSDRGLNSSFEIDYDREWEIPAIEILTKRLK